MATSKELKSRLQKFLADPKTEDGFRYWFASLLTQPNDPELEALAHAIDSAFSDAAEGQCTPQQLKEYLAELAEEKQTSDTIATPPAPKAEFDAVRYIASLGNGPVYFGYGNVYPTSYSAPSVSGAFYSHVSTSPQSNAGDKTQPTAWETVVVPPPLAA